MEHRRLRQRHRENKTKEKTHVRLPDPPALPLCEEQGRTSTRRGVPQCAHWLLYDQHQPNSSGGWREAEHQHRAKPDTATIAESKGISE